LENPWIALGSGGGGQNGLGVVRITTAGAVSMFTANGLLGPYRHTIRQFLSVAETDCRSELDAPA
jgi:hypothetical protein